jgi:hypothetical protein
MKILWIDLNSSYAHSSLALPALHAQIAKNNSVKWEIVSATINENYDDWPFLWGQNEGTIGGNTSYLIFGSAFKSLIK